MNEAIEIVDEVSEDTIPPASTIIEGFRCHPLDRDKSRRYVKKLCKNSEPEVGKMIGHLPVACSKYVIRNSLEAVDAEGNTVMRFNLKKNGPVFL